MYTLVALSTVAVFTAITAVHLQNSSHPQTETPAPLPRPLAPAGHHATLCLCEFDSLGSPCKRNQNICPFVSGLFHVEGSSTLKRKSGCHSLSGLKASHCAHTCWLSMYPPVDTCVPPTSWPLQTMLLLLQTLTHKYLLRSLLSILLGVHPGLGDSWL